MSIFAGWPNDASLAKAVAQGNAIIRVFPKATERNTTRYLPESKVIKMPAPPSPPR